MAADSDKTQIGPADAAPAPAKPAGSKKLLLYGGIGAGILVVGVALALFVLKPMLSSDKGDRKAKVEQKESKVTESHQAKPKREPRGEGGDPIVLAIKDIVVNPAGTAGSRFLSVSFGFELQSNEAASAFENHEPLVRDALITILSSKTLAELTDAKQKEIMRVQIRKRLSQVLQTDELTGVYYTDFVLQ